MSRNTGLACALWFVLPVVTLQAAEPKWQSLLAAVDPANAVAGEWTKASEALRVSAANGARLQLPVAPKGEYDFRVSFTRQTGQNSIVLFLVHGGKVCACEVDAWGQHLGGLQNIADRDLRQNPTRTENIALKNGRRYTLTVEVRKNRIRALLDDKVLFTQKTSGADLSLPDLWRLPSQDRLGIGAWNSATTFHAIDVRSLSETPLTILQPDRKLVASVTDSPRPDPMPTPSPLRPRTATGKKVLIVIANRDFFYREYAEPREELERAGFAVTVAAGRTGVCRPHANSGQGNRSGEVTAEIALADVKAADYDAILFSGGWGASMYQFAFNGRYNNNLYNGDRATKTHVNRVINEFIAADKYVCALCNAVSVLAWARVDGRSPLRGKRVCAPTRAAAAGIYNGRQAQPSCRWHPEANGAILSPAGRIGDPRTNRDDVLVDGKIITGEDDPSAREMGRRIARVLSR